MKLVNLNGIHDGIAASERVNAQRVEATRSKNTDEVPVAPASAAPASDQVTLSSRAEDIARLVGKTMAVDDIRHDRVSELRHMVRTGQYHVSSHDIAEAIMRDEPM